MYRIDFALTPLFRRPFAIIAAPCFTGSFDKDWSVMVSKQYIFSNNTMILL